MTGMGVAQEIHYLSALTGIKCSEFRHLIVTGNETDPLPFSALPDAPESARAGCAAAALREGHLFVDEGCAAHKAFDEVAIPLGITRRLDCKPEPGMAPNVCYIVPAERSQDFEELARGQGLKIEWGVIPVGAKVLLSFNVSKNFTWIVTAIYLRTLPAIVGDGDFRSDDFDYTGFTNAWITVNNKPLIGQNQVVSFGLFNKPVLLPFASKKTVKILIERGGGSLPATDFQVHLAINGYLAPQEALDALAPNSTNIVQPPAA